MKNLLNVSCVKIAALILVLTMIFSYIPNALAMQGNNEIQNQDYWTAPGNYNVEWYNKNRDAQEFAISTPEELAGLSVIVNGLDHNIEKCTFEGKTINLTENLNMEAHYWTPIGYTQEVRFYEGKEFQINHFKGSFKGNSHTISKLKTNDKSKSYQGLFGNVIAGSIKKLGIIDSNIVGQKYIGGIAGLIGTNSTIEFCYNKGKVKGIGFMGGGVVGFAEQSAIQSCVSKGEVEGENSCIGGVVGYLNQSTIKSCVSECKIVKGETDEIGGIVGCLDHSTIEFCYNKSEVNGTTYVGGVVGASYGESKIQSCYNNGKIKGIDSIGGILGGSYNQPCSISSCYNTGNVTGYFNTNEIKELGHVGSFGGIAGCIIRGSTIQSCYNTGNITVEFEDFEENEDFEEMEDFEENEGSEEMEEFADYLIIGGVGGIAGSIEDSTIKSCYSIGSIKVTGINEIGGIVGSISLQDLCDNCYYCNDEGKLPENANQIGNERSLDEMKTQQFVNNFGVFKTVNNVQEWVNDFFQSEEINQGLPVLNSLDGRKISKIKFNNFNKSINKTAEQHIFLAKMRLYAKAIKLNKLGDMK